MVTSPASFARATRAGPARADRRRDRRQLRHRARDGPARPRRGSRRDPHRAQPGPPAPRRPRARGQHRGLRRHRLRPARSGSSTSCPDRSTTCWSPAPVPTTRRWPSSTSTRHAATSTPISCCRCRSLGTPRARSAREGPCFSWAAPAAAARHGPRVHLGAHRRASRHDEEPRARARARPREPDRGRVRRHAVVGGAPRRPARRAPRAAPHHAADPAASSARPTSPHWPSTS